MFKKIYCAVLNTVLSWPMMAQAVVLALFSPVYYGTGANPTVFDSLSHLRGQEYSAAALDNFSPSFWLSKRSITSATFFLNYHFSGHNVVLINATNLFFHFLCSLAVFCVIKNIFDGKKNTIAHFSSLIFFIHPVTVYASLYHIQRSIILATLFSLLGCLFYLEYTKNYKKKWALFTAISYFLAVQSKEHSVMLPLFLASITYFKNPELSLRVLFSKNYRHKYGWLFLLLGVLMFNATNSNWGVVAHNYEGWAGNLQQQINPLAADQITSSTLTEKYVYTRSVFNQSFLFFKYLALLAFPATYFMSIDIPEVFPNHLFQMPQILFVPLFFAFPYILWCVNKRFKAPGFCLCLVYPWVMFLTELSTVRFHEIFVLYRSYLWLGVFVAVPVYLIFLLKPFVKNIVLFVYLAGIFIAARDRIITFTDKILIWEDAAKVALRIGPKASSSYRPLVHLGGYYALNQRYPEAIQAFNEAIILDPGFYLSYFNLANIYKATHNYDKAIKNYTLALKYSPQDLDTHIELTNVYLLKMDTALALSTCQQARLFGLNHIRLKSACGSALLLAENFEQAAREFQSVLIEEPHNNNIRLNLVSALIKQKKYNAAFIHLQVLYQADPQNSVTLQYLDIVKKSLYPSRDGEN